jgi:hypothetical protein
MGNWYEIIHLRDFTQKAVLDAAGRILDRFKLPHGKINFERFLEALPMAISRASDKPPG